MTKVRIVFFGRNPAIMALMKHQIASLGHEVEAFLEEREMVACLREGAVALLILGPGIETEPRMNCRALCRELGVRLLEHQGGPDDLVRGIHAALVPKQA